jgi:Carboxypeptidase regulatory-like domain/TonB dependent receptor-like, beta-barrel/TonB-dependent Receptor Plug Domain
MNKTFSKILFPILISLSSAAAFAQGTTGTIEGTIKDPNGAAIAGATVSIENQTDTAGFKKTVTTDEKGFFIIAEIPSGSYRVAAEAKYFRTYMEDVRIFADDVLIFNPFLDVGGGSTTVVVYYEIAQSEGETPQIRTNNKRNFLEKLPRRTTFNSLLKIVPNVRFEPLAAGFQIDGASGAENTFFIDGQEVTNFRTGQLNISNDLPFEFLEEVQVKSATINAEYGGALGGVVNVVTRGGNNQWRGNLGISFTPDALQGRPNVFLNRFGANAGQIEYFQPPKDDTTGIFPTASIGAPIFKDKLWFFASYSPQIYRQSRTIDYFTTGANPSGRTVGETVSYEANLKTEFAFVRLDAQPVSSLRMFGTFLYNPTVQDGALPANSEGLNGVPQSAFGLRGAEFLATRGGRENANSVNGQATWNLSNNFYLNFRAGRSFLNEKLDSYGIPRITRYICSGTPPPGANCSNGFQNVSNNSIRDYDVSERTTFDAEAALVGIDALGRHDFKFGYGINRLFNKIREGNTDTGLVQLFYGIPISSLGIPFTPTAGNLGSGFLQRVGTIGEARNTNYAFYAQDSWTIWKRLMVNFGIRFENENFPDFNDDLNIGFNWGNKISPRFGFAFDVLDNGKTKIFGGYGWYYDRLKYESMRSLQFPAVFFRDYFEILPSRGASYTNYTRAAILGNNVDNPNGICPIPNSTGWSVCQFSFTIPNQFIDPLETISPVDPDLKPSRTSEYSIGVEQKLGADWFLSGRFIHRQLDRAIEDAGIFNSQGSEAYIIGNPGFGLICEIAEDASLPCVKAERKYDALEIIVDKRAQRYFFNASYTFSRLFGNYSGLASSDQFGVAAPNVTRFLDLPFLGFDADGNPDNGRLATDRPHVFKAFGGYTYDWSGNLVNRTSVSAFTTVQSGTPLTTVYNLYNQPSAILFGRGDLGRTGTFSETDLFVSHRYSFGEDNKFSIEPYAVILNLFDQRNELSRQTSISSTIFTSTQLTQGGCTTCAGEIGVIFTILRQGGIARFVQNYLNARGVSATGLRNDYNLPNAFQAPRYVRFGMRFQF